MLVLLLLVAVVAAGCSAGPADPAVASGVVELAVSAAAPTAAVESSSDAALVGDASEPGGSLDEAGAGPSGTPTPYAGHTPEARVLSLKLGGSTATPFPLGLRRYVVQSGDTVYGIARRFGFRPEAIVAANPALQADPDLLYVGQQLAIPGQMAATPVVPGLTYRVQAGDVLGQIAERHGVDPEAVAAANGLEPPYPLGVGQVPLVPGGRQPIQAASRATPASRSGRDASGLAGSASGADESPRPTAAPTPVAVPPSLPANLEPYQADFLKRAIGPARQSDAETGIPASVTLAQAILESDWGRSRLAREASNYFGIKASGKAGPAGVVWMLTYEAGVGYVNAPFRAYRDMAESFVEHGKFFFENRRYEPALALRDMSRDFARAIHRAGYATDPGYSEKLLRYMDRLKLETYDAE